MNRRGFLALLGAALAEPLTPKGTAFSFLGGIYRPAWQEVPTVWPIPLVQLFEGQSLTIEGRPGQTLYCPPFSSDAGEIRLWRSPNTPPALAATLTGLSPMMNDPRLLRDRDGNWLIRDAKPSPPVALPSQFTLSLQSAHL